MKTLTQNLLLSASLLAFAGCGKNILSSTEPKDPAEDSTIALENEDPSEAIKILNEALADDPDNPQYLSLLAMAYAQRAGVDVFTLAQNMGASQDDESSAAAPQGNEITALFGVMPEANEANLADIDLAVSTLASIPSADLLPDDTFKIAIYQTASIVMHTKALDIDGDGQLSPEELAGMTSGSATVILNQLLSAQSMLGGISEEDTTSAKAAEALTKAQAAIDASPGDTAQERLKNYLGQQGS